MSSSAPPTFEELRDCVKDVIRYLRLLPVPNIGSTKVCVIGGLAMWNYLRQYRATTVLCFAIGMQFLGKQREVKSTPHSPRRSPSRRRFYHHLTQPSSSRHPASHSVTQSPIPGERCKILPQDGEDQGARILELKRQLYLGSERQSSMRGWLKIRYQDGRLGPPGSSGTPTLNARSLTSFHLSSFPHVRPLLTSSPIF